MSAAVLITRAEHPLNQHIAHYLHHRGDRVLLLFDDSSQAEQYASECRESGIEPCHTAAYGAYLSESEVRAGVADAVGRLGGLDVLVHGFEGCDEHELLEQAARFHELHTAAFRRLFLIHREAVQLMIVRKSGHILFPMITDGLYASGYTSSPIMNHGKLSLMKSAAKELSPFKIRVNAITFGYYDRGFTPDEKKAMRKSLDIIALKPQLPTLSELVPSIELLLHPAAQFVSGQNLHIGAGVDTIL